MDMPSTPDLSAAGMTRRQLHFVLAVDCSGSMTGEKMASLNYAVRSAIPAMRAAAADNPENDVLIRVLRFSDNVSWTVETPVPVDAFEWTDLTAGGETNMGAAFTALAHALTSDKMPGRQLPPVLVMLSDGLPTDDAEAGLAELTKSEFGAKAIRIAVAIGSDADKPLLQSFIGHADMKPLQANSAETLVNRIKWAASVPMKAASAPVGASMDSTQNLAQGVASENENGGELVW
jgi:uncharacterized protein YegL